MKKILSKMILIIVLDGHILDTTKIWIILFSYTTRGAIALVDKKTPPAIAPLLIYMQSYCLKKFNSI